MVTLNPPDCGYINFSTLIWLMFPRPPGDDLLYMKTCMASVVFRHEQWLPSVVSKLGKWRLQKLCASGKINKYSCHWGKQFNEILFYPLPTSTHQFASYMCLELTSNVFSLISHPPLLKLLIQKMELSIRAPCRSPISQYRCRGSSSLPSELFQLTLWLLSSR